MIDEKRYCRICFNQINDVSFHVLSHKNNILCEDCFSKFSPKFIHFKIGEFDGLSIYEYDQNIKDLLFKFKGCYDIELKDVFLDRYFLYLKLKYHGYSIVPVPSFHLDDEKRGFNHVEQIYSRLFLPILNVIEKTKQEKQANKNRKERTKVGKIFKITDVECIKNKKILIVDDVLTTGSSVNAVIELIKKGKPKKIKVLVVAKNIEKTRKR